MCQHTVGCALTSVLNYQCVRRVRWQGHLLLVGVGGSGKQSLARLAAFAAGCAVFEIQLACGYGKAAFLEDLKALYTMLGENKKVSIARKDKRCTC